ncbi:MAG: hypothetical protein MAG451_02520 [Anaerolineales bacterium]|nr:hypothetical protein [Anaerolineales bacterium]
MAETMIKAESPLNFGRRIDSTEFVLYTWGKRSGGDFTHILNHLQISVIAAL